jgi:hypothetical protein
MRYIKEGDKELLEIVRDDLVTLNAMHTAATPDSEFAIVRSMLRKVRTVLDNIKDLEKEAYL